MKAIVMSKNAKDEASIKECMVKVSGVSNLEVEIKKP